MAKKYRYTKTPTVYQMEATECGAASLAMILGYFGKFIPLEQMRVECGVSRDGCNAKNILRAARKFGLECKGVSVSFEELLELNVPSVIHWNFNHFVVWEGVKGKYAYINDPALGRRKLTLQEVDECFTGICLLFQTSPAFSKEKEKTDVPDLVKQRLNGQYKTVLFLLALGLLLVVPGLLVPAFSQIFVDDILIAGRTSWLSYLIIMMVCTMIFKLGLSYYKGTILELLKSKMGLISAHRLLSHMFRLPMTFFDQRYAGDLSARIKNDENISDFLAGDLAETVLNIFTAIFYLIILVLYSPILTLIGLVNVLVSLALMKFSGKVVSDLSIKQGGDSAKLMGTLFGGLSITASLKAAGVENEFVSRLLGYCAKNSNIEQKFGKTQELLNVIPEISRQIVDVLVLLFGSLLVIRGDISAGVLVAYTSLLGAFVDPINELSTISQKIHTLKADLGFVNDIFKYPKDKKFDDTEHVKMNGKLSGRVDCENIAFGYDILKEPLVENFDFHLEPGSSIAFVGASGSGKSTASKLISGLYLPWDGDIKFDGVSKQKIPPEIMAASIATVSQEITLFSGTIRDNLTMWNKNVMDVDLVEAAKDACIHDVITQRPGAYDFVVEENGSNFSGGQRQRLEIARALVTNPSILIMDEATSALDPLVEKKIVDNIKRRGCTCIIVAHRLSAIRDCDEIIVMDSGKIAQRGTHEELSKVEGHYKTLIQNL